MLSHLSKGVVSLVLIAFIQQGGFCLLAQTEPSEEPEKVQVEENAAEPVDPEMESEASTSKIDRRVVVTANRIPTLLEKTAASVTVVTRDEIETRQLRTLTDALRQVPGLNLAQSGAPGQVTGVFMRGSVTRQTPILVNGLMMPFDASGDFNIQRFNLDNVERIEVVRGPMSSLYGGPAVGGVINIITRDGKDIEGHEGAMQFEAGSFHTFRESISAQGKEGAFDYSIAASRLDSDFQRDNNQTRHSNISAVLGWDITDVVRMETYVGYNLLDVGSPNTVVTPDPNENLLQETWQVSPRLIVDFTEWWTQTLTYQHAEQRQVVDDINPGFFGFVGRRQVDTDRVETNALLQPLETLSFNVGSSVEDVRYRRYNNALGGARDQVANRTNVSANLSGVWEPVEGLALNASFRQDFTSDFGNPATWRAGASYTVPYTDTVIHGSYGTAFSPPNILHVNGNPSIQPEDSEGWEVGLSQPFYDGKVEVGATYFENEISGLIAFPPPAFTPINIQEARTTGVETSIAFYPYEQLSFQANYTYTHQKNLTTDSRTVRIPRHKAGVVATWLPIEQVALTTGVDWVYDWEDFQNVAPFAQIDQAGYFIWRATVSWQVNDWLKVFGRMENILDEQYEQVGDFPALDRGLYAGFELSY